MSNLAAQFLEAGTRVRFSPYGLNADVAYFVVCLAVGAIFVRSQWRATALSVFSIFSCAASLVTIAAALVIWSGALSRVAASFGKNTYKDWIIFIVYLVWWLGAVATVFRSIEPERRLAIPRAFALWAGLFAGLAVLPYYPTFRGEKFDIHTANLWELIPSYLSGELNQQDKSPPRFVNRDEVDLSQAALMDAQLSRLVPQVRGKPDIYVIGIAGSSEQDVFWKELEGGLTSLSQVFPVDGHVLKLVNHPDAVKSLPVASLQNFSTAVRAVARVMDRKEDVLLLFITSHGSSEGVALSLPGDVYGELSPAQVARVFDQEGIMNRIIVVSACYSGVFVKPLANAQTIILTAADENNPSFGCSNEREWTYFGDALFNHGLRSGSTLEEAFLDAKVSIGQLEVRDGLRPSNPQGYFGSALTKKLRPIYRASKDAMILGVDRFH